VAHFAYKELLRQMILKDWFEEH